MEKSIFALFFGSPDHELGGGGGGEHSGASYSTSKKKVLLVAQHILLMSLQNCLKSHCKISKFTVTLFYSHNSEESRH